MTAVEWLVSKIQMVWEKDHEDWIEMPTRELLAYAEQAKQMEREQIENAYISGQTNGVFVDIENAKYYYTETFKK